MNNGKKKMGKIEKKRTKMIERINMLQYELSQSLKKKNSKVEINVASQQRIIHELKLKLSKL